ncbi:hypothetical protein C8J57DRAFT_1705844 [Mycena rebaudengoi]|nr:hypothetical protein C8J57DRAFT_1705844 [Mycena rebaudengoi]
MNVLDGSNAPHFTELVDGVRGTLDDLASLVIKQVDRATSSVPHSPNSVMVIGGAATFIDDVNDGHGPHNMAFHYSRLTVYLGPCVPPIPSVQLSCLDLLVRGLAFCADHSWILAALNANLLGAIIMYNDHHDSRVHRYLAQIFEFLFASMVYYRVVSQAQNALSKVQSLAAASSFVKTPIFKDWSKFSKLAAERVKVLDEFNSQKPTTFQSCGNMECSRELRPKTDFWRCLSCEEIYYCSRNCQTADWQVGHRESCMSFRRMHLGQPPDLTTRAKAFIRAVLNRDYEAAKHDILIQQIVFMKKYPGTPFFTSFDYIPGAVSIQVERVPMQSPGGSLLTGFSR